MSDSVTPTDGSTRTSSLLHYLLELALIHVSQRWCHPPIPSSTTPFSFCFQSFPASGSFPECWLLCQVAKVWSFSFSNNSSTEYSGLISFWNDWFDLLAVQETLKSLLQHHSLKSSILWGSALFMDQLSHPYMTTGKTIVLIIRTFVNNRKYLLFNTLPRFVIAFLPRRKCLSISWLQLPSAVILEPKKIKAVTVSIFPIYLPWSDLGEVIVYHKL